MATISGQLSIQSRKQKSSTKNSSKGGLNVSQDDILKDYEEGIPVSAQIREENPSDPITSVLLQYISKQSAVFPLLHVNKLANSDTNVLRLFPLELKAHQMA